LRKNRNETVGKCFCLLTLTLPFLICSYIYIRLPWKFRYERHLRRMGFFSYSSLFSLHFTQQKVNLHLKSTPASPLQARHLLSIDPCHSQALPRLHYSTWTQSRLVISNKSSLFSRDS